MYTENDVERVLLSADQLKERVAQLAESITQDYKDTYPLFIAVLKGSFVFYSDLLRAVGMPVQADFMSVSSYGENAVSSGRVKIIKDSDADVRGRSVLIVEDIIDSGNTLYALKNLLLQRGAKSVKICALLDKASRRTADIAADYVGFEIEDEFVIGYGLDYAERYRNLPYVGILKRSVYEK
ncbi:MAG: hypoxanthine phosphoribosyltransferase [Clostridia bacterium]|nr:hypoxanthine phosphoribosyltransferase [Clostridia bacterium]